jgi:hypothetical protein
VIKHNRSATLSAMAGIAGACLLATLVSRMGPVAAQTTGGTPDVPPPTGPAPRLPSGRPDLSGVWNPPYVPDMTRNGRRQEGYAETPFSPLDSPQARQSLRNKGDFAELPFTASGLENWKTYDAANGDYSASCLPYGFSRSINSPYPFQLMHSDQYLTFLFEVNTWFHVVKLGADHPQQLEPTWFGDSVGRWDGDTLIVDTIRMNEWTRLDTIGHPHSDALHLVQTFKRTDLGHIAYSVTIEDPKTYTKPWKNERTLVLYAGPLLEYSCEENNKDLREGHITVWTPPWVKGGKN